MRKVIPFLALTLAILAGCVSSQYPPPNTPMRFSFEAYQTALPKDVKPPVVLFNKIPIFPISAASNTGETGCALVAFDINAGGQPTNIHVIYSQPTPDFGIHAQNTLSTWRFSPAKRNGKAIAVKNEVELFRYTRRPHTGMYRISNCNFYDKLKNMKPSVETNADATGASS